VKFGTAWKSSQQVAVELLFDSQGSVLQHGDPLCLITLVDFLVHALPLNILFSDVKRLASATFVQRRRDWPTSPEHLSSGLFAVK
jgi:hypothetical protein